MVDSKAGSHGKIFLVLLVLFNSLAGQDGKTKKSVQTRARVRVFQKSYAGFGAASNDLTVGSTRAYYIPIPNGEYAKTNPCVRNFILVIFSLITLLSCNKSLSNQIPSFVRALYENRSSYLDEFMENEQMVNRFELEIIVDKDTSFREPLKSHMKSILNDNSVQGSYGS